METGTAPRVVRWSLPARISASNAGRQNHHEVEEEAEIVTMIGANDATDMKIGAMMTGAAVAVIATMTAMMIVVIDVVSAAMIAMMTAGAGVTATMTAGSAAVSGVMTAMMTATTADVEAAN
mmetsp:Transcript_46865/g.101772  ORF Transcript_46865/g.101772 Transcript_46865/m.101772 type:complete len:122 (+) Transcript_46865:342-707(+)